MTNRRLRGPDLRAGIFKAFADFWYTRFVSTFDVMTDGSVPPDVPQPMLPQPGQPPPVQPPWLQAPARLPAEPWGFWPTAGYGLVILFASSLAQVTVALFFVVKEIAADPSLSAARLTSNVLSGPVLSLTLIASSIVGAVLVAVFIRARQGISIRDYLALKRMSIKTVLIMLVVTAGLLGLAQVAESLANRPHAPDFMVNAYRNNALPALLWISVVLIGPAFEEACFRGFLFAGFLKSRAGPVGAVLLTAALWALLHGAQYQWYDLLTIFVLGIALGIMRIRTGSLWSSFMVHATWNLFAMIGTALYVRGVG